MKAKRITGKVILAACLAFIVLFVWSGFYRVGQGEEALVLTFGRVTDTNGPGLYWRIPLVQSVVSESVTTIHTKEYGFRTSYQGGYGQSARYIDEVDEGVMLTNDNSIVSLEAIYQYTIVDVHQYRFNIDDPEGTLQLAFEAVIRRNIQNRSLDDALLNKEEIEQQVLPDFQALVDSYSMGVKINDVRIQNITVPAAVAAAYEDVNNAKNEKTARLDEAERYKNNVIPAARSAAYELLQEAEAYKAETIAAAEADVAVFSALYEKYVLAPEVTRSRMVYEVLEKVLSGSAKLYIVDSDSGVTQLLNLGEETPASGAAAILGGE